MGFVRCDCSRGCCHCATSGFGDRQGRVGLLRGETSDTHRNVMFYVIMPREKRSGVCSLQSRWNGSLIEGVEIERKVAQGPGDDAERANCCSYGGSDTQVHWSRCVISIRSPPQTRTRRGPTCTSDDEADVTYPPTIVWKEAMVSTQGDVFRRVG